MFIVKIERVRGKGRETEQELKIAIGKFGAKNLRFLAKKMKPTTTTTAIKNVNNVDFE